MNWVYPIVILNEVDNERTKASLNNRTGRNRVHSILCPRAWICAGGWFRCPYWSRWQEKSLCTDDRRPGSPGGPSRGCVFADAQFHATRLDITGPANLL